MIFTCFKKAVSLLTAVLILFFAGCNAVIDSGTATTNRGNVQPPVNTNLKMTSLYLNTDDSAGITSRTEYVKATISTDVEKEFRCDVRCRGNYSFIGVGIDKKSYRVRFEEKINFLGIGKGKARSYVLLANWCDRSLLRNAAAFEMASVLSSISFVSEYTYVKLYLNGEYRGIYQLCEQSQTGKTRVNITEDPEEIDADYFIELDCRAHKTMIPDSEYFVCDTKEYVIKNDEYHQDAALFLKDYFNKVTLAIEEQDEEKIRSMIDLDSFVDMYILQEYTRNIDVGWSSFFLVKKAGGKLYLTCPWDFDLAFGNDVELGDGESRGIYVGSNDYAEMLNSNPMLRKLMNCSFFSELVKNRFNKVGKDMKNSALKYIDTMIASFEDELASNFLIWPVLGKKYYPIPPSISSINSYIGNVQQLKNWIEDRYVFLSEEWKIN